MPLLVMLGLKFLPLFFLLGQIFINKNEFLVPYGVRCQVWFIPKMVLLLLEATMPCLLALLVVSFGSTKLYCD
jgi:hypothetical protein